jgi:hypothetical protein
MRARTLAAPRLELRIDCESPTKVTAFGMLDRYRVDDAVPRTASPCEGKIGASIRALALLWQQQP